MNGISSDVKEISIDPIALFVELTTAVNTDDEFTPAIIKTLILLCEALCVKPTPVKLDIQQGWFDALCVAIEHGVHKSLKKLHITEVRTTDELIVTAKKLDGKRLELIILLRGISTELLCTAPPTIDREEGSRRHSDTIELVGKYLRNCKCS